MISFNCENEGFINTDLNEKNVNFEVFALKSDEIPQITTLVEKASKSARTSFTSKDKEENFWIDTENIVGVTDSVGNHTYAYRLYLQGTSPTINYNLLVTERTNGEELPIVVMEYEIPASYIDDLENGNLKSTYERTIKYYSLNSFFSGLQSAKNDSGEPDPCGEMQEDPETFSRDGNSSSSSSGGSSSSGSAGGGSGEGSSGYSSNGGYTTSGRGISEGGSSSTNNGYVEVGEGCFCGSNGTKPKTKIEIDDNYTKEKSYRNDASKNNSDCIEDTKMLIPINNYDEHVFNDLTGKADCVYQQLKSKNGNLFKKTIGKFVKDPKYNLILQNGNCEDTNTACTNGNSISTTGNVYITIEDNTAMDFDMAATILHEAIHAELWRYVAQYKNGINPNDKKEVFKYYKHYAEVYGDVFDNNENNAKNAIDHIYMTQHYINPLASTLRQLDNNKYPLDYYKSYAWDGLRAWDPNNTLGAQENSQHYAYRAIVNANSKICN